MGLFLKLVSCWAGFLLLWLLFAFGLTTSEILTGAAASAVTVTALYATFRSIPLCFDPRLGWLAQAWRLPGIAAKDFGILLAAVARAALRRPSQSVFQVHSLPPAPGDCRAAAQRALTVLFLNISPNSVVLDIDRDSGRLFFHELKPAPLPKLIHKLQE